MKQNRNTIIVVSAISIVVLGLIALHFYNQRYLPKYNWTTNYVYNNDQPYGTNILYHLLNSYSENNLELIDQENLRDFLNRKTTDSIATYFVIGNHCNYEVDDVKSLKKFVKKGNTVFIALEEIPFNLIDELKVSNGIDTATTTWEEENEFYDEEYYYEEYYYDYNYNYQRRTTVKANFVATSLSKKPDYRFFYKYNDEIEPKNWKYVDENFDLGTLEYETLGVINRNKPNYIRIQHGRGQILIHTNPMFFSNLQLLRPSAAEYTAKVFSYFPEGPIYWDRNSKLWSVPQETFDGNESDTPFSYILKQKSLRWAFYMIWSLVILFVLFNLWRKQKAIPVKFPKSNSTLEFIHTIGELYFTQKNNRKLALQKMNMFIKKVRTKYYITEKDEDKFMHLLAKKSEIEISHIQNIFAKYHLIKNSSDELQDDDLIIFYQLLKTFTKNSK